MEPCSAAAGRRVGLVHALSGFCSLVLAGALVSPWGQTEAWPEHPRNTLCLTPCRRAAPLPARLSLLLDRQHTHCW